MEGVFPYNPMVSSHLYVHRIEFTPNDQKLSTINSYYVTYFILAAFQERNFYHGDINRFNVAVAIALCEVLCWYTLHYIFSVDFIFKVEK